MDVEKISIKKISESVIEQIEAMIESGTFQAGDKLPSVRELCDMFGVGRTAVRDAIITLKGKGTVDVRKGEGTYICGFDSKNIFNYHMISPRSEEIGDLYQVRKILEPGIAETAAINRLEKDIQIMENILLNEASHGWKSDYNFHMAIAKATGNEIISQLMQFISTTTKKAIIDFHNHIQDNSIIMKKINEQHQEIYEAIKMEEHLKANQKMTEHLELVEELLQKSIFQEP